MHQSAKPRQTRPQQTLTRSGTTLNEYRQQAEEAVHGRPLTSVMTMFGLGLGAGLVIGTILSRSAPVRHPAGMAERVGRSILDSITHALPESFGGKSS